MKRRTFLQGALGAAAVTPVLLDKIYALPSSPLHLLAQLDASNDKILIFVQMFGGNDGLNTVVPADDPQYYVLRDPTNGIGILKQNLYNYGNGYLNPGLARAGGNGQTGFAGMLGVGTLAIIQGIGYDNPNLSHFRSTDIWLSGINDSNAQDVLDTGWLGRFLERQYPNFPNSLPADPLAINFGGFSLALTSEKGRMGIEVANPSLQAGGLSAANDTLDDQATGTRYATEYAFVQDIANRSNIYAQRVKDAYTAGKAKLKGAYGSDSFSQQMASVAALIAGGLDTRIYYVSLGGFDTHVSQASPGGTGQGAHSNLLHSLSDAVAQFQYDLLQLDAAGMDVSKRVVGMTMSEFGRRPQENASYGTDHGAASVQFVFGAAVASAVFGQTPDLSHLDANGDLAWQIDYRTVYAAVLTDWFGLSLDDTRTVMKDSTLEPFPGLFKPQAGVAKSNTLPLSLAVYPNPLPATGTIAFDLPRNAYVKIEMTSMDGRIVQLITEQPFIAGSYALPIAANVPTGAYVLSMRAGDAQVTRMVTVIK
ncbi:MAG: DUF1501 domain-containing protein [Bacteroidota bacterium]|nr:DUF1501 domain-containing protein [Bacteroidota bacterium]MDP4233195.1 DUF1501 domain-containing protein [Bacteroidota bacterium]MDP4242186.1 DUF1501 domain-containing protein [Bacteroidota bacterium]MDP4287837.1 DUF1501 domain-containing protein [Bacteroidota bacterium]